MKDIFEWKNSIIHTNKQINIFRGGHVCLKTVWCGVHPVALESGELQLPMMEIAV